MNKTKVWMYGAISDNVGKFDLKDTNGITIAKFEVKITSGIVIASLIKNL